MCKSFSNEEFQWLFELIENIMQYLPISTLQEQLFDLKEDRNLVVTMKIFAELVSSVEKGPS